MLWVTVSHSKFVLRKANSLNQESELSNYHLSQVPTSFSKGIFQDLQQNCVIFVKFKLLINFNGYDYNKKPSKLIQNFVTANILTARSKHTTNQESTSLKNCLGFI